MASGTNKSTYQPSFNNVRGSLAGYSDTDSSPSWQNRKAFIHEMTNTLSLDPTVEPTTWDEVLEEIGSFLDFWKLYYCGIDPTSKP